MDSLWGGILPCFLGWNGMPDVKGATPSRGAVAQAAILSQGASTCPQREFSQAELLELIGAGSDWIWETDPELRFSWVSDNYERITGVAAEKVLGRFRFDFLRQASQESRTAAAHLDDLQARRPFRDFVYELKGGRDDCRWISTTGFPRYDADGAFLGYRGTGRKANGFDGSLDGPLELHDTPATQQVPERPLDEAVAGENHMSDFERALDAMKMGVVLVDADLNARIVNKAYRKLSKMAPDEAPSGSPFRELMEINRRNGIYDLSADQWDAYLAGRLDEIRAGDVAPREFRHADGSTMIYSVTALSGGKRLLCYYDISEIKHREAELAETLERSRLAESVVNSVKDPIFVKDENLRFVFVNEAFSALYGKKPADMLGRSGGDFLTADEVGTFEESELWVLATGERYEVEEDFEFAGIGRSRVVRKNRVSMESGRDYVACFVFDITEMKQRETEAEEARRRLADVLESMPAGVIIYDRDDRFVLANRKLKDAMPALAPSLVPGTPLRDVLKATHAAGYDRDSGDPELDALYDADPSAWIEGFAARYRVRHSVSERRNRDGKWFQATNMRTDEGTFIGVRADISDIKERERDLRRSMRKIELFRHVLDELPVATYVKSADLVFEFVNKAWTEITGISKEEAAGHTDRDFFSGESEGFAGRDLDVLRTGVTNETEETLTHTDGTQRQLIAKKSRLVASDGSVHLIGSSTDITEVKAREVRLQESQRDNEIFRSLIDNVPVAIYAKRDDLKLFYVNNYWTQLTGVPADQALGRTDVEVSGENGLAFMESDRVILQTGDSQEIEETLAQADGSVRYQIARKGSLVASDGSLYLLGSTIDVTEQKEREKQLQEAQRHAVLADRAKSEFLANMSHEIRTPMNGVLGMAELLAKSNLDPKQKTFTEIIVKSGNALLTIINDILDFSKIDAGQMVLDPAPFRLAEAIEDVATLISTRAKEKDIELIVRVEPGLGDVYLGDVGRLRQIITNLIGNAVKFTDAGHVLVDVSGEPAGGSTRLRISVTDTGIGIPADKLGAVFEKFSQVDASSTRRHEGTGLGLAITSRLVALMGGEIGVESTEGRGSTFWFTVTLPNAGQSGHRRVTPFDVTGARILVVDDNPVNRAILTEQMSSWTFDACAAENGIEGLKVLMAADALGLSVDCIVLDYQMPGMTGAEMARIVRATERVANTPIVMLTSVDQSLSNSNYRDLSIDAQLIKPARSSILLETLVSTIQKHRSSRAGPQVVDSNLAPARRFESPGETAPLPSPAARRSARPAKSGNHRVDILVAEDNEVNQLVFTQILGETDYSFEVVGNGRLALKAFGEMNPGMILMDVSMPEMNGLEATGAIRSAEAGTGHHVPIIGVTAHALKGDRERCLEAGMDDYLPKPISPKALIEKVERWTRREARESRNAG